MQYPPLSPPPLPLPFPQPILSYSLLSLSILTRAYSNYPSVRKIGRLTQGSHVPMFPSPPPSPSPPSPSPHSPSPPSPSVPPSPGSSYAHALAYFDGALYQYAGVYIQDTQVTAFFNDLWMRKYVNIYIFRLFRACFYFYFYLMTNLFIIINFVQ
jgi:hypothetical protein